MITGTTWGYVRKNIEDIEVGDLVFSYDTASGCVSQNAVTDFFVRESDHINYLTAVDENGRTQTIETTDSHPFWVVTDDPDLSRAARDVVDENGDILYHGNIAPGLNGYWVEAKDLREGDVFVGANGELSTLQGIVRVEQEGGIAVFNFTVEGDHNYFILAKEYEYGQTCILVHNAEYDLGERAKEIHELVPKRTQNATTIAVTDTAEGTKIISSSERRLRPAQRAALRDGEIEGIGLGHAEVTGVEYAKSLGLTPTTTAASRPICPNCKSFLDLNNITH